MADVDAAIAAAALRYWRDLRSYDATAAMRQAARRGGRTGGRGRSASSSPSSAASSRCSTPSRGARAVWLELAELVSLWLAATGTHHDRRRRTGI